MAIAANGSRSTAEKPGRFRIPLWLKFAAVMVALVTLLLLAGGAISLWWGYNEAQRSALAEQQKKAETLAGRIGGVMADLERQLTWTAQPAWKNAGVEQQSADFRRMLQQFPPVTELFFIDGNGIERLKVSRFAPDSIASQTNHAAEPRFVETVKARTWFGPAYVRNGSELSTTVGMVHADGGVSVAEIDLAFVGELVNAAKANDDYAFVVDRTGRLIAHPDRNAVTGDTDMSALPQVKAALAASGSGAIADAIADGTSPMLAAYAEVPGLGWRVLSQTPQTTALASFQALLWQSALLLGVGSLIAAMVGMWLARRVAAPIRRLQAGAERLGEGDLAQRVAVRRRDEIGALAEKFNTMASLLQQSHKGLEARIDDRAVGLDIAQQQQAMTAEMLKTIGRTDYELEPVLDTLIGSAVRLSEANVGAVWLREGASFRLAAQLGHTGEWIEAARQSPFTEGSHTHAVAAAAAYSGQVINVDDVSRDLRFMGDYGERPANSDERAALAVPLKHGNMVEAVFSLSRADPIPFTERQVAVTQDFADEALVAIRNMRLLEKIEARDSQLQKSFEQQTATGDILRVISQSPSDIQPVLDTIVASAVRLCNARYCYVDLFDGTLLHFKAHHGLPPEAIELISRTFPTKPGRGTAAARAVATGAVVEIPDMQADPEYEMGALAELLGAKSAVAAPLLKDGTPIGVITIEKLEAGALPERQVELLKTFAEQAVIAMVNFKMFEEIEARNRDVTEALEQQTATAEVLKTISSSAFDLDAVLHALVKSASDLCRSGMGYIYLRQGDVLQPTVQIGWSQEFQDRMKNLPVTPGRGSIAARVAQSGTVEQIADVLDDPEYTNIEGQRLGGFRTLLGVPLLRDGAVNGVFVLARPTVSPFSAREIELVRTFSDQAVIAIENVRLFEQVQARTAELGEALEQQTATADVLKVISRAAFDLRPILQTLVDSAIRLGDGDMGGITLREGDVLRFTAGTGPAELLAYEQTHPHPIGRGTFQGRAAIEGTTIHVPDVLLDAEYERREAAEIGHFRAILAVPLKRDQETIGVFGLARRTAGPFTPRQIELVETFADQAVIAIENARLFDEVQARTNDLQESLTFQKATSDVLEVIGRSASSPQPVFDAIVDTAAELCRADIAVLRLLQDDSLHHVASSGAPDSAIATYSRETPILPSDRSSVAGRVALERRTVQINDVTTDPEYTYLDSLDEAPVRTTLGVPLMQDGRLAGVIILLRKTVDPFSQRQIDLVQTFADQAVIAIENARLFDEVQARTAEVSEALQQQTATGEVLRVIASSPADIRPVLDAVVESAARLCDAYDSILMFRQDGALVKTAHHGPILADIPSFPVDRDTASGRAAVDRTAIHVHDISIEEKEYPAGRQMALRLGHRTVLATPLMREGEAIGVLLIRRTEVRPFSEKQIQLLKTFADQAVIAIENARLFDEVQARTADVSEALRQQTATADVLKVISRSAFDLQTVLDTLAESAAILCEADIVDFYRLADDGFQWAASFSSDPEAERDHTMITRRPGRGSASGRVLLDHKTVHIPDFEADPEFTFGDVARKRGVRSILGVPLLREDALIGLLLVLRKAPGPFGSKQIELAETFADQAVIAIENVRLFDEVQARTAELGEALQQQTATADVLKVISASAFDLQTVLDTLVESAVRLCRADKGCLERIIDGRFEYAAITGFPPGFREYGEAHQTQPGRGSAVGRAAEERRVVQIEDVTVDAEYTHSTIAAVGGMRTVLAVPLLREGELLGTFAMIRTEVRPFSDREIELVKTFADQAVIAIENVRLFDEVQARTAEVSEALKQQTATADVLKVISASAFDLDTVLTTLTASAASLCNAGTSGIFMLRDGAFHISAAIGILPEHLAYERANPQTPRRGSWVGRAAIDKAVVHVPDVSKDAEHEYLEVAKIGGFSAVLCVPLLREGAVIGVFGLTRPEPGPFTERQIELVQTFADQAVIAIENVRLFDEVQARTADVSEALRQQTATADVLKVISRAAFDLPTVLNALVESAARLCGANYGGIFLRYGDMLRGRATISERLTDWAIDHPIPIDRRWISGRVVLSGHIEHIPDVEQDREFNLQEFRAITDTRALMGVPLLREGKVEGVFFLGKPEPGAFTARQSELVQTFSDQAVIAIENVRLFDQVQARTQELAASLQDLQAAQGRLLQTEKLASLGQLTAGIAHEIKNPLNFVSNFSLLSNELVDEIRMVLEGAVIDGGTRAEVEELGDTLKDNLNKVVQHAKRADSIVRNMLMHSREGSSEHRVVDINAVVDESLGLAYHGARAEKKDFNVTLEKNYDPRAGSVDLYPQEITRVLLNLIANGFYATEKRGAEGNGAAYEPMLSASTKNLGDAVEIRIRDNGTGIPPEVKERMFNPFFTTKPAGEGTGLGLSLSHDIIVKQHSGTIEVETVPGSFTEFRIVLPRGGVATVKAEAEVEAKTEGRA